MRVIFLLLLVAVLGGRKKRNPEREQQERIVEDLYSEQLALHAELKTAFGQTINVLHTFCDSIASLQSTRFARPKRMVPVVGPAGAENGFHDWLNKSILPRIVFFSKLESSLLNLETLAAQITRGNEYFSRAVRSGEMVGATKGVIQSIIERMGPIGFLSERAITKVPSHIRQTTVVRKVEELPTLLEAYLKAFRNLLERETDRERRVQEFGVSVSEQYLQNPATRDEFQVMLSAIKGAKSHDEIEAAVRGGHKALAAIKPASSKPMLVSSSV